MSTRVGQTKKPPANCSFPYYTETNNLHGGRNIKNQSEFPSNRQPDATVAVVADPAVDVETAGIEDANDDTVNVQVERGRANVDALEQSFAGCEEVADDGVDHHLRRGRLLVLREECLLFAPGLSGRVIDRSLPNELPTDVALVLGEDLLVVPVLGVELVRRLTSNVENRHREHSDEDVGVLARGENFLTPRHFSEVSELLLRRVNSEVQNGFLDAEEIPAHDLAGTLL